MASTWLDTHPLLYGNLDLWIGVNMDFFFNVTVMYRSIMLSKYLITSFKWMGSVICCLHAYRNGGGGGA